MEYEFPQLRNILADVCEHFVPITRSLQSNPTEGYQLDKSEKLTAEWVYKELDAGIELFRTRMREKLKQVS